MTKFLFTVVILTVFLGCANAQLNSWQDGHVVFDKASVKLADSWYDVEYAHSYEQRAQGLMFRKTLCDDCGMLFKFSTEKYASMWMKNTHVALDVAYIDASGVIVDIKPLMPHNLESVVSSKKVLYALEMNQGWFSRHNIRVGDQIEINR